VNLRELAVQLRAARGIGHKLDIRPMQEAIGRYVPMPQNSGISESIRLGDDCAAIPDGDSFLLFAIEGLLDEFVTAQPWFAGYCGIMVNISDIYAMGGRPLAVVNALWGQGDEKGRHICAGMLAASERYGVPIVGGHTNSRSNSEHLAVAILGRANRLLTSFDARPGDMLLAAIDLRGEYFDPYPYWNASTTADPQRLRADLELLPRIAEDSLCSAAKDISMGGVVGTLLMLLECSGIGATLDVSCVPRPADFPLEKWLISFPSFGFILAVAPQHVREVEARFNDRGIACAPIGSCDDSGGLTLANGKSREPFWNLREQPLMGFGPAQPGVL
jgi:AIR synthase-related protein